MAYDKVSSFGLRLAAFAAVGYFDGSFVAFFDENVG